MATEHRLWIGAPGRFQEEVDRLLALLRSGVLGGELSIRLSPQRCESFDWIGDRDWTHDAPCAAGGFVSIQTSGTTGEPRWVAKRLADVLASRAGGGTPEARWLLCYNPARWAGLSVIAHVMRTSARLVVPRSLALPDIAQAMAEATHVSLTPSMFRRLLVQHGERLADRPLRQISFGGEYASQKVLDEAKRLWPAARVTHVYACTELGDICAVSDGREGLPLRKAGGWRLAQDGELIIDGHATRDLWRAQDDRLYFLGRLEDTINVGGAKVHPATVESACMAVPGIYECRAFGVRSALLGQVVALDYVGNVEPQALRARLLAALPKVAVPAQIEKKDALPLSAAGKLMREARP